MENLKDAQIADANARIAAVKARAELQVAQIQAQIDAWNKQDTPEE